MDKRDLEKIVYHLRGQLAAAEARAGELIAALRLVTDNLDSKTEQQAVVIGPRVRDVLLKAAREAGDAS